MTGAGDSELKQLLDSFVRVRLIQMGGVDLSVFQFDPFLTWAVFMMNGDRTIYGRYGTASPRTKRDRKDSNPNHSLAGLKAALRRALDVHSAYGRDRALWAKRLAGKTGPKPRWNTIESMPAAKKYGRLGRIEGTEQKGCAHCHEVQRALIDSHLLTKTKVTDDMLWVYPSPALLGLTLSRSHCARVSLVAKKSFAAKAGFEPGDDLLSVNDQPLLSVADLQWVLHTFPDEGGTLSFRVRRGRKELSPAIELPATWRRKGDFGWRYRVAGYAMWLWSGVSLADDREGVRVTHLSPWWFKKPNREAREALKVGDVIVEVDGRGGWTRSTYLAYLMREKKLGSVVRLRVVRHGKTVDVRFSVPSRQPEVLGH